MVDEKLKLYVWGNPYTVSFGSSVVFSIGHNIKEARELAKLGNCYGSGIYKHDMYGLDKILLGKPDRIVKVPCAEWYEWEE